MTIPLSRPTLLLLAISLAFLAHANPIHDGSGHLRIVPDRQLSPLMPSPGAKRILKRIVVRAADAAAQASASASDTSSTVASGGIVHTTMGIFTPGSKYFIAAVICTAVVGILIICCFISLAKYIAHLPRFNHVDDYPPENESYTTPPSYRSGSSLTNEKSAVSTTPSIINRDSKGFFPMHLNFVARSAGAPPALPSMSEKPAERRKSQGLVGMGSTAHSRHGSDGSDNSYEEQDHEIWDEKTHSRGHSRSSSFGNSPTRAELPRTPAKTWLSNELDSDGRRKLHLALPGAATHPGPRQHQRSVSHSNVSHVDPASFPQWSRDQQAAAPSIPIKSPRLSGIPVPPSRSHRVPVKGAEHGIDEFGAHLRSSPPEGRNRRSKSDEDWRLSVQSIGSGSLHVGFADEQQHHQQDSNHHGHRRSGSRTPEVEMKRSRSHGRD